MFCRVTLIAIMAAIVEARFGQEQIPIPAIEAVTSGGAPGVAATLAGSAISTLLAAANPCAKLQKADEIVAQLGTGADSIAAAKGLVAAEQNFNPFNVDVPSICSDPTLPTTAALRGIVPLIDPAVVGSATENANSNTSVATPFDATNLSVAQVMIAQGFTNFTSEDLDGTAATASGAAAVASASVVVSSAASSVSAEASASSEDCGTVVSTVTTAAATSSSSACVSTTMLTVTVSSSAAAVASSTSASTSAAATASTAAASSNSSVQASTISGLDFGLCVPTMKFEAGLDGRADTEFTFQAIDPLVNKGQEEALNPNIITNRICDQLTNVCEANAAAKTACTAAKAQISALGTKDVTTADAWNTALGFAGTNTNPDNAPQAGLVGHD